MHLVRAGLINLGEVRAFLKLLPHHRHQLRGIVRVIGIGQHVLRRIVADGVFVPAQDVDGIPADAQPRTRDQTLIDRVADRCIGRARTFGPHVAFRGEARHQVIPSREHRHDRALRH